MLNLFHECLKIDSEAPMLLIAGPGRRSAATAHPPSCPRVGEEWERRTPPRRRGRTRERGRRPSRGGTPTSTTEITVRS